MYKVAQQVCPFLRSKMLPEAAAGMAARSYAPKDGKK